MLKLILTESCLKRPSTKYFNLKVNNTVILFFTDLKRTEKKTSHVFPYLHTVPKFKIMASMKGILSLVQWHLFFTIFFYFYWKRMHAHLPKKSQYMHSNSVSTKKINEGHLCPRYKRTGKGRCSFYKKCILFLLLL